MCPPDSDFLPEPGPDPDPGKLPFFEEEQLFASFAKKGRFRADDPALYRLAQAIVELTPDAARLLCVEGLASLPEGEEKAAWLARLHPFLGDKGDGGSRLPLPA